MLQKLKTKFTYTPPRKTVANFIAGFIGICFCIWLSISILKLAIMECQLQWTLAHSGKMATAVLTESKDASGDYQITYRFDAVNSSGVVRPVVVTKEISRIRHLARPNSKTVDISYDSAKPTIFRERVDVDFIVLAAMALFMNSLSTYAIIGYARMILNGEALRGMTWR